MSEILLDSDPSSQPAPIQNRSRVLLVLGVLWGENGITSHLLTLAKGLRKAGWEVALVSGLAEGVEGAKEEALRAVQIFEAEEVRHFLVQFPALRLSPGSLAKAIESLLQLNAVIQQFKPDVIHVHSLSVCPYIQVMHLLHRVPFVSTCHMEPAPNRLNVRLGAFANKFLNTMLGDRVIAISSALKDAFATVMSVPEENIRLICHGLEEERFRPPSPEERRKARSLLGVSANDKVICLIGRLAPVKGHDLLIQALAILRLQGMDVVALCAGKGYGNEAEIIQKQATQAQVSDLVRLVGFTDPRQVLWASDVITLPSRNHTEAFALVIAEAMFCGVVPIRTPAAGAIDQIEDGTNGFVIPFDDPEMLAARLRELFEKDELRTQMAAAALETARKKFTLNRMIEDVISVYEEVKHEG